MSILAISGSSRDDSSNRKLVEHLRDLAVDDQNIEIYPGIKNLPLFNAELDHHPWPKEVLEWRMKVGLSKGVIFCTPEYLYNLPAVVKNAMEWISSSGELNDKPVLAITYSPRPPRGDKAMQSLTWTLQALGARILTTLSLYQSEMKIEGQKVISTEEQNEMLMAALELLY